jgi:uncharacterized membrane protein
MNKEVKTARILMLVSGLTGATFFILANFVHVFEGSNLLAGLIQLCINTFVFFSWKRGYETHSGKAKTFALIGTVVPCVMASITLFHVIIPEILKSLPQ